MPAFPDAPPALCPWPAELERKLHELRALPARARASVAGLGEAQLDTPLRPGGWTPRQVIHHVANAHLHAYLRVKFLLLEERGSIKPWDQDAWEAMEDETRGPVEPSLLLIDGVHARLAEVFARVRPEQWARTAWHPESGVVPLRRFLDMYSWHGGHHVAQVEAWRRARGW